MLVTFLVVAYSLCSSMLLILNKVNLVALVTRKDCWLYAAHVLLRITVSITCPPSAKISA